MNNTYSVKIDLVEEIFGSYPPPPIPESIFEILFNNEDGACFALLDAARLQHLPQILASTDLEYRCLFQGDAESELEDVAPWLVKLSPNDKFTRRLLTGPNTKWGFWGHDAAVFLRSHSDLLTVRKSFRRLTRLYDPGVGRWFYFRFYAAPTMRDMISGMEASRLHHFFDSAIRFIVPNGNDAVLIIDKPNCEF